MILKLLIFLNLALFSVGQQPHIVFIFIDDLGWNDVGYHGSEIMTPNIDQLAADGVKLENYFVQPLCSPSRTQFMTGRYQIHTCAGARPFEPTQVGGLSLNETTMTERLKEVGYSTHMIGKWHLGHSSFDYVPTGRGFDTFYGLYNGYGDHYDHTREDSDLIGVDLHDDVGTTLTPIFTENGTYSSYLFAERAVDIINNHNIDEPLFLDLSFQAVHTPLQAPQEYIDLYEDIEDEDRRIFAAMMTYVDDSIANITAALQQREMWNNTVFIFSADNGGGRGSDNSPLRADKGTYFNGGIQGVAFVASPLLTQTGVEYTGLLHVSDWMATLVNLAGGDVSDLDLDGFDVWDSISDNTVSPRAEILHHIDPDTELKGNNTYPDIFDVRVRAALNNGVWKIMTGDHDTEPDDENILLFNLVTDPSETTNVAEDYPEVIETLLGRLAFYNSTAVPPCELETDPEGANPDNHGGAWMPWL